MVSHILEKRVFLFQANVSSLVNSIPENLIFNKFEDDDGNSQEPQL